MSLSSEPLAIFYDLEFCGQDIKSSEITQIGAVCPELKWAFNQYILPTNFLNPAARWPICIHPCMAKKVTKVIDKWRRGARSLYHMERKEFLPSVPLAEGLTNFLTFLMIALNLTGKQIIHFFNYGGEDHFILRNNLLKTKPELYNILETQRTVWSDVQNIVDNFLGSSRTGLKEGFKIIYQKEYFEAHNAFEDAMATYLVYKSIKQLKSFMESRFIDDSIMLTYIHANIESRKEVENIVDKCVEVATSGWLESLIEKAVTTHTMSLKKNFDSPHLIPMIQQRRIDEFPSKKQKETRKMIRQMLIGILDVCVISASPGWLNSALKDGTGRKSRNKKLI